MKGKLVIEFDDMKDLLSQLCVLVDTQKSNKFQATTTVVSDNTPKTIPHPKGLAETTQHEETHEDPQDTPQESVDTPSKAEETSGVVLSLEEIESAEYDKLLEFCRQNPEIGVDAEKSQPPFFRKRVEMKIRTFLETQ